MTGTECTPEQLRAAEEFLGRCSQTTIKPGETYSVKHENLIRLLAWYGAVRFRAGMVSKAEKQEMVPGPLGNPEEATQ